MQRLGQKGHFSLGLGLLRWFSRSSELQGRNSNYPENSQLSPADQHSTRVQIRSFSPAHLSSESKEWTLLGSCGFSDELWYIINLLFNEFEAWGVVKWNKLFFGGGQGHWRWSTLATLESTRNTLKYHTFLISTNVYDGFILMKCFKHTLSQI